MILFSGPPDPLAHNGADDQIHKRCHIIVNSLLQIDLKTVFDQNPIGWKYSISLYDYLFPVQSVEYVVRTGTSAVWGPYLHVNLRLLRYLRLTVYVVRCTVLWTRELCCCMMLVLDSGYSAINFLRGP